MAFKHGHIMLFTIPMSKKNINVLLIFKLQLIAAIGYFMCRLVIWSVCRKHFWTPSMAPRKLISDMPFAFNHTDSGLVNLLNEQKYYG